MANKYKYLSYGMGFLTITIISRWGMGYAIFTAPSSFIPYGILGPISFSIAGILSFMFLIPLILSIRKKFENFSLEDILKKKLTNYAYKLFMVAMFVGTFASVVVITYSAAIILTVINIPFPIGFGLFMSVGYLVSFFLRSSSAITIDTVKMGLLFLTIIFLLVLGYVIKGTESVYQGVRLYHPYIIYMNISILPILITAFAISLFGHLIVDRKTWSLILLSNYKKLKIGLFTSGVIWSTIPLSFTMITFSAIQHNSFTTTISMFSKIFLSFDNRIMILVVMSIFIFIFIISLSNQITNLFGVVSDIDSNTKLTKAIIILFSIIGIPMALHLMDVTLLDLFFVFGTFFAAMIPIILWIFWTPKKCGKFPFIVAGISTILGWVLLFLNYDLIHIIISFGASTFIMGCYYYLFEYEMKIEEE